MKNYFLLLFVLLFFSQCEIKGDEPIPEKKELFVELEAKYVVNINYKYSESFFPE